MDSGRGGGTVLSPCLNVRGDVDSGRGGGTVLSPCLNVRGMWTVVGVVGRSCPLV